MTMTRKLFAALLALLIAAPALAQNQRMYSQPELDQMLAPVALYPDPLLSQVLMAATYPDEVAEAANWSRVNPGLQGDDAVRAAEYEDWDPSVKSLLAFPQILQRMAENPQWTQSLGEAFLAQEPHVMDSVQQLRRRAHAAGYLQSSEQVYVQQQGQAILIQPASPQYIYVPYYDPLVVYGTWWWPAYRPVHWSPWPRNHGVHVSFGFFFGNFDWHHRHVRVVRPTAYYYHRHHAHAGNRNVALAPQRWRHEPQRRAAFAGRQVQQVERREARQAVRMQAQPAAVVPSQPAATVRTLPPQTPAAFPQRAERREERREERRMERQAVPVTAPVQSQPAATVQVQQVPAAIPQRAERREERREERRVERQAAPVQVQPAAPVRAQPLPPPATQPRSERREERQAARAQTQPVAPPAARVQAPAAAAPQIRMPAASAQQTPRAERQEQRQERREQRLEQRRQRG